jgi:hypothetical protein
MVCFRGTPLLNLPSVGRGGAARSKGLLSIANAVWCRAGSLFTISVGEPLRILFDRCIGTAESTLCLHLPAHSGGNMPIMRLWRRGGGRESQPDGNWSHEQTVEGPSD